MLSAARSVRSFAKDKNFRVEKIDSQGNKTMEFPSIEVLAILVCSLYCSSCESDSGVNVSVECYVLRCSFLTYGALTGY